MKTSPHRPSPPLLLRKKVEADHAEVINPQKKLKDLPILILLHHTIKYLREFITEFLTNKPNLNFLILIISILFITNRPLKFITTIMVLLHHRLKRKNPIFKFKK